MTDGIIQKVIRKYIQYDKLHGGFNFTMHEDIIKMEQELIEKIKQKRDSSFISYYENILYKWLIGDNQE